MTRSVQREEVTVGGSNLQLSQLRIGQFKRAGSPHPDADGLRSRLELSCHVALDHVGDGLCNRLRVRAFGGSRLRADVKFESVTRRVDAVVHIHDALDLADRRGHLARCGVQRVLVI
jgi:hypothetical protein